MVNHHGATFEVTPEMQMRVRPFGDSADDPTHEQGVAMLKAALRAIEQGDVRLPTGFWDAYLDEGHWDHDEATGDSVEAPCDCPGGVHKGDDVFVRLSLGHWEDSLGVFAHDGDVTINGESYNPEDLVRDLLGLMAVFQYFEKRGEL